MQEHRRVEISRPLRDRTADSLRSLAVAPDFSVFEQINRGGIEFD